MEPKIRLGPRIIVTGSSGSGKRILAQELSSILRRGLIRLDPLVVDDRAHRKPQ